MITQGEGTGLAPNNAAYKQFIPPDYDKGNVTVKYNLVQGSQDCGFVLPFTSCDKLSQYPFADNTAGSCFAAFVLNILSGKRCIGSSGHFGYASYLGLIANPPGALIELKYENLFFVDNYRSITLRYAHEIDDNTLKLSNSYVMGYSRPTCASCYSD